MKKLIIFLILSLPFSLKAQTTTSLNNWTTTLHLGAFASSVPSYLEETMKAQGYQPHSGGFLGFGSGSQPMARQEPVLQLAIEKFTPQSWSGKLLFSTLSGHVAGISSQLGDLRMEYKMVTTALLGGYHSKQRITKIAVGPALHFFNLEGNKLATFSAPIKKNYTKIGFAVEGGLRFPAASRFFFDYNSQYHLVGKRDIGAYHFEEVDPTGQAHTTTFTAGKKSFNYLTFNFGLGVRFGNLAK